MPSTATPVVTVPPTCDEKNFKDVPGTEITTTQDSLKPTSNDKDFTFETTLDKPPQITFTGTETNSIMSVTATLTNVKEVTITIVEEGKEPAVVTVTDVPEKPVRSIIAFVLTTT